MPALQVVGKVLYVDEAIVAQDKGVLDDVLQLPDVALQLVPHQDLHDRRGHALDPLRLLGVEALHEVLDQVGYVLPAFGDGRDGEPHHGQAEVEIIPKAPLADESG